MPTLHATLASYLLPGVVRRIAQDPTPTDAPRHEAFSAAVLFADITGFTALAERLAERGPGGAEALSQLLNEAFGHLIELVAEHGGEVSSFAGDALLALWPAGDEPLPVGLRRAAQCALAMQQRLAAYAAEAGQPLAMRLGVGVGPVDVAHLGGFEGFWAPLVAGAAVAQAHAAESYARPGDVMLAPEAWAFLAPLATGEALGEGDQSARRLLSLHEPLPPRPAPAPALGPATEAALRAAVPEAIRAHIAAGQAAWLAELRRVSVLFIGVPDLDPGRDLAQAQVVVRTIQGQVARYGGSVNKLSLDEKGATLVAAMGLPPRAHEDDARRAAQCALGVEAALQELGVRFGIGVTTGRAFCGSIGNERRREYTLIGDVVNLAARLMQAAPGGIRCDAATARAAEARVRFASLPPIRVKGKAAPVEVFCPEAAADATPPTLAGTMVGREAERARLGKALDELLAAPQAQARVIIVEGEPGIGKSLLTADLARRAAARGVAVITGAGDATEQATPYYAWKPIVRALLAWNEGEEPARRRAKALERVEEAQGVAHLAPLLNDVVPLGLPENEVTGQLDGQVRAENTRRLLTALVAAAAQRGPLLLIVEDAHWLDSASWPLLLAVASQVAPLLLVAVSRPPHAATPPEYERLAHLPAAERVALAGLSAGEVAALLRRALGVREVPDQLVELVYAKAQGSPFFSEELAFVLRDTGALRIAHGVCAIAGDAGSLGEYTFPDTLQGVIMNRVDQLKPRQQLALKTASVIGRSFAFPVLRDVYPIADDRPAVADALMVLDFLDFTRVEAVEPDMTYRFKHVITHEVTYNLMLFAQRRRLHRAVAEWYERAHPDADTRAAALLAYHWSNAIESVTADPLPARKAVRYLSLAGEQALRSGAYREAVTLLGDVLRWHAELEAAAGEPARSNAPRLEVARWERQLGYAYLGLGNMEAGRAHLERATALLGWPVPTSTAGVAATLLRQQWLQLKHRLTPQRFLGRAGDEREVYLEGARSIARLTEIYFFANDIVRMLHTVVGALNLAEEAGASPELAQISGTTCNTVGVMGLHGLARLYLRQAEDAAATIDELGTYAWVGMAGSLYAIGLGEWETARAKVERALELWERLGDRRYWEATSVVYGMLVAYADADFVRSTKIFAAVDASGRRSGNAQARSWGLLGMAENALRQGWHAVAFGLLEDARPLASEGIGRAEETRLWGLLALARLRAGDDLGAEAAAARGLELLRTALPTTYYSLEALAALAETWCALWEAQPNAAPRRAAARDVAAALGRFAGLFPIAGPRAALWRGECERLDGRAEAAARHWRRALAQARRLRMPYDEALAHQRLGAHGPAATAARHRDEARRSFTRLGVVGQGE